MSEHVPAVRVILNAPEEDLEHCLALAKKAMLLGDEGEVFGHWISSVPDFSAVIRINKNSVSVRGIRKLGKESAHD